jgi:hypothetical protein
MASGQPNNPFYSQVTKVNVPYMVKGEQQNVELHYVSLPAGTVLFRGLRIPNEYANEDIRYFYRDFLGDPEGPIQVCLQPTHNVFFFTLPYIAFGVNEQGPKFHSQQAVVLVHPITLICMMSPSPLGRADGFNYPPEAPLTRCHRYNFDCHKITKEEHERKKYDNCLNPTYAKESGVRGWTAVAGYDSLLPKVLLKKGALPKETPMGSLIHKMEKIVRNSAPLLLSWAYTDNSYRAGYPEIALFPYKEHPGLKRIVRVCKNNEDALRIIESEAARDNLNYLPLAAFTKRGVVDMVNGLFSYDNMEVAENIFDQPPVTHQSQINKTMWDWMEKLQTEGIDLPYYGHGKLTFDTRTGYFVLPQILAKTELKITIPKTSEDVLQEKLFPEEEEISYTTFGGAGEEAESSKKPYKPKTQRPYTQKPYTQKPYTQKKQQNTTQFDYMKLLLPLSTPQEKNDVLTYTLFFRTFFPEKFMEPFRLRDDFTVRRAMIFNRPNNLRDIFEKLQIKLPNFFQQVLKEAGKQYGMDSGKKEMITGLEMVPFKKLTQEQEQKQEKALFAAAKKLPLPPAPMTKKPFTTRVRGGAKGTRSKRSRRNTTRKTKVDDSKHIEFAKLFKTVWKKFALSKA